MPELSTDLHTFYAQQGLITDPREHVDLFADLPADIPGLVRTVQGLLLHLGIELASVALTISLLDLLWGHRGTSKH